MSVTSSPKKKAVFDSRKMWFIFAIIAGVIGAAAIFFLLMTITATSTYYVLNRAVPARTLVTEDMLTPVTTSEGGEPRTALDLGEVLNQEVYTRYALEAGDILTASNAGELSPLTEGLPGTFVVASFKATPSVAAGGKIQRGDYIDLSVLSDESGSMQSHLFLQRVLVIDATVDLDSSSSSDTASEEGTTTTEEGTSAADNSAYRTGVPVMFTVGLSQQDAQRLAVATNFDLYVTLTSADSVESGAPAADLGASLGDILTGSTGDAGAGTDNTFGSDEEQMFITDPNTGEQVAVDPETGEPLAVQPQTTQ